MKAFALRSATICEAAISAIPTIWNPKVVPCEVVLVSRKVVIKWFVLIYVFVWKRKRFYERPSLTSLRGKVTITLHGFIITYNKFVNTGMRSRPKYLDTLARLDFWIKLLASLSLVIFWACASIRFSDVTAFFLTGSAVKTGLWSAASVNTALVHLAI